jgi:hypothetical protein
MADIFVSYMKGDRDWALWIAKELEALDHKPHIHEWEIEGGDDVCTLIVARRDAADRVLCVVLDDYPGPYLRWEFYAALWQAANKRPRAAV